MPPGARWRRRKSKGRSNAFELVPLDLDQLLREGLRRYVLRCLLHGHSNKIIARDLGITDSTVKVHLKAVLRKINASNRTQAAIWALNHGLGPTNGVASSINYLILD